MVTGVGVRMVENGIVGNVAVRDSTAAARLDELVGECAGVLGAPLTAYLAGAGSVAQLREWLAAPPRAAVPAHAEAPPRDEAAEAVERLRVARDVIDAFAAANRVEEARPWLREAVDGTAGGCPASLIRDGRGAELRKSPICPSR